jgi:hypothetical protein
MTASEDMAERHGRMLARLAELSLSLAEDVHAATVAAPEPDQKARLAEAFHRIGRAMRQSIALEARLVRDRARDQRAAQADAAEAGAAAVRRRRDQVRADLERQIWCEVEPHDAPAWLGDLDERLEAEALYDGFTDEDVEAHIARLSAELGLTGEAKRDYTPRICRPDFPQPRGRYAGMFSDLFADEEDDDDEEEAADAPHASPSGGKRRDGPQGQDADGGRPPDTSPIGHSPAASGRFPPEGEVEAPPEPPRPPPDPPPRPPDPEPYVPPWDRIPPGASFPDGSGY